MDGNEDGLDLPKIYLHIINFFLHAVSSEVL